jgi:uncharacterized protein
VVSWLTEEVSAVVLSLHIQPGARKTEIVGEHGGALKIRLAAPPVDGKANLALIDFLAHQLDTKKSTITLISGEASRIKRLRVSGLDAATVRAQLKPAS